MERQETQKRTRKPTPWPAPAGYLTPRLAAERTGVRERIIRSALESGRLRRVAPPPEAEGQKRQRFLFTEEDFAAWWARYQQDHAHLTLREAAVRTGQPLLHVRKAVAQGRLPSHLDDYGERRVAPEAVEAWAAARRHRMQPLGEPRPPRVETPWRPPKEPKEPLMELPGDEEEITVPVAAALSRRHENNLRDAIMKGRLPARKIRMGIAYRHYYLIRVWDLKTWLQEPGRGRKKELPRHLSLPGSRT